MIKINSYENDYLCNPFCDCDTVLVVCNAARQCAFKTVYAHIGQVDGVQDEY